LLSPRANKKTYGSLLTQSFTNHESHNPLTLHFQEVYMIIGKRKPSTSTKGGLNWDPEKGEYKGIV
jgi:hypothetical protein